jgi:thiamine monophosphate kinase
MCGWALARAQAKAGDSVRISGYIGNSEAFDEAITRFAGLYADQCEEDYDVFKRAIREGKIPVELEDAGSA